VPEEARGPAGQQDEQPDQRSGDDIRRRGWYWHWNSIVTQYAPLIGLKGIGLLNSYTVWTDRREDSPHRGYAFPSQQAESAFYGEDRAELITINKILVALDLIEVRKEMVLHADEKGRRWRVPHNLYRVKDNANGFNLTVEDVLRVTELAARTPAVYRYIRRVFSPNFSPIDPKNPWHEILPAVRQTETWQKLAAKAAREDARASARSKAGHKKRKGKPDTTTQHADSNAAQPGEPDVAQPETGSTSVAPTNIGQEANVRGTNNGFSIDVAESNRAFAQKTQTIDAVINEGGPTVVQPANRTYDQESVNTTTTTTGDDVERDQNPESGYPPAGRAGDGAGPVLQSSATVLAAFESANDRSATTLERELLGELERDFADAAQRADRSPAEWVVAAIREAVNSGSRFVAPKRVREILSRWTSAEERRVRTGTRGSGTNVERPRRSGSSSLNRHRVDELGAAWRAMLAELQGTSVWADVGEVLAGSVIAGEDQGRVRIDLDAPTLSDAMQAYLRQEIEPRFIDYLKRTVSLQFETIATQSDNQPPGAAPAGEGEESTTVALDTALAGPPPVPRFSIADGLTNAQVWAAAQEELRGRISSANFETWIRPASLIGRDAQDRLVLGVPNRFAQQRVESKLLPDIQSVVSNIIGQPVEVVVVVGRQWLRENRT
jgi:hypothetical protein